LATRALGDRALRAPAGSARAGGLTDERRELPARVHLAQDVGAADELPTDVELRDRRPAGVLLDGLALLGLGEHVDGLERHADLLQHLHGGGGKAAHRERGRALHVEHDLVLPNLLLDLRDHVVHPLASCGDSVWSASAWMRPMSGPSAPYTSRCCSTSGRPANSAAWTRTSK